MARAWIEMPAGSGWGQVRAASRVLHELGYATEELRGSGNVLLRLAGSRLEAAELLRVPGEG